MGSSSSSSGVYIPTTQVWDVTEIHEIDVTKPEFKELLVRMYQNLNSMSMAIGTKESSFYSTLETVKGQAFNPRIADTDTTISNPESRQVFNKVVNFGALPNTATKSVAHDITTNVGFSFTRIYGCATKPDANPANFRAIPIPYVDPGVLANGILLNVDGTNVNITTAADYSAYTVTYVILEYIKC